MRIAEARMALAPTLAVATVIAIGGTALAQAELPPNNIDCAIFTKVDGQWRSSRPTTIELGNSRVSVGNGTLTRRAIVVNGYDVYEVVDRKCGKPAQ